MRLERGFSWDEVELMLEAEGEDLGSIVRSVGSQ